MKVIAISGKAESGKTYTANLLQLTLKGNSAILPFASSLKRIAREVGWLGEKDEKGRTFLQNLGKVIKEYKGKDIFAKWLIKDIETKKCDYIIIDDLRMPEELKVLKESYGKNLITIRVDRPFYENSLTPEQREDISETGLDIYDKWDYWYANTGDKKYDKMVIGDWKGERK